MGGLDSGQGSSLSSHAGLLRNKSDVFLPIYLLSVALFSSEFEFRKRRGVSNFHSQDLQVKREAVTAISYRLGVGAGREVDPSIGFMRGSMLRSFKSGPKPAAHSAHWV